MITLRELLERRPDGDYEERYFETRNYIVAGMVTVWVVVIGLIYIAVSDGEYFPNISIRDLIWSIISFTYTLILIYFILGKFDARIGRMWRITLRQKRYKYSMSEVLAILAFILFPLILTLLTWLYLKPDALTRTLSPFIVASNFLILILFATNSINIDVSMGRVSFSRGSLFSDKPIPKDMIYAESGTSWLYKFSFLLIEITAMIMTFDLVFTALTYLSSGSRSRTDILRLILLLISVCTLVYLSLPVRNGRYEFARILHESVDDPYNFNQYSPRLISSSIYLFRWLLREGYVRQIQERIELVTDAEESEGIQRWKDYFSRLYDDIINYRDDRLNDSFLAFKKIELSEKEQELKADLGKFEEAGIGRSEVWEREIRPRILDVIIKSIVPSIFLYLVFNNILW